MDAAPGDAIAADATVDTELPDTAELTDSTAIFEVEGPDADAEPDVIVSDVRDAQPEAEAEVEAGPPPFCNATDPNLIGCYRFEDTEHATQPWDDSMYAHHGTSSGVTFGAGKAGRAMVVNGTGLVNVPDKSTLGVTTAITIEAFINPRSHPTTGRVGLVDSNGNYGLYIQAGGILRATAPAAIDSPAPLTTGWQHVAYTYDGSKQVLYINGVVVKENALAALFPVPDGAGLALGMNSPSGEQFDGSIDSVRIYRVARTAMQICRAAGTC